MKMYKPTVIIGIPAYNEESNISNILTDIANQEQKTYTLEKVIVVSDGSTDKTVEVSKNTYKKKIEIIDQKKRSGIAKSINEICKQATSDIVVTLDADIRIKDKKFIGILIEPIVKKRADYTSSTIRENPSKNAFVENISTSMQIKRLLYESLNRGINIYTSYGLARAFNKDLYKKLDIPVSIGNDMYIYLFCKKYKYTFVHTKNAVAYYNPPKVADDYRKQSARFFQAKRSMEKYFGTEMVKNEFRIPMLLGISSLRSIIPIFSKHPLRVMKYCMYLVSGYLKSLISQSSDTWDIAASTKGESMKTETTKPVVHVLTKYFYPVAAGIETNILETYSSLANEWDIHIHTTKDEYLKKNSLPETEVLRGLTIHRYDFTSESMGYMPTIKYDNASVVALHNFNLYYWRLFIKIAFDKVVGRKKYLCVVTPHGGFNPEWSMFPTLSRFVKRTYHQTLGVIFLNYIADKIRTVSKWEKAEMVKCGVRDSKIKVIPNGLEKEAFNDVDKMTSKEVKARIKSWGDYVIQVGRIYPIKNYETVIRSLPLTSKSLKYIIVGSEEKSGVHANYKDTLIKVAKELKVEKRVIFAGIMRGNDKYYALRHAITMVHPAKYESYCNVVHEALSQGLIPIVANNTALPFLIKNDKNGYLVETTNHIKLAERINFVTKNRKSKKLSDMSKRNVEKSQGESWENVGRKMREYYEE